MKYTLEMLQKVQEDLVPLGLRPRLLKDYHLSGRFDTKIYLNECQDFEVNLMKDTDTLVLSTTYSNQEVTRDYINQLYNILRVLERYNEEFGGCE